MTSIQELKMKEMLKRVKEHVDDIFRTNEEGGYIIDPNDGKSIEGHYAASHAAVAYLLYGQMIGEERLIQKANLLVEGIMSRWDLIRKEKDFHADFNLFALCLYYDYANAMSDKKILVRIRDIVLSTEDSPHETVNWLPMRIYVNKCRFDWTSEKKYLKKIADIKKTLSKVTYSDYYIDDRAPIGISFNVQYDIATVANLYLLEKKEMHLYNKRMLDAVLDIVLPDGDVNYLGRGCNQIFAWGPWLYLLCQEERESDLELALDFFDDKIENALKNNNLLLNLYAGDRRWLWWDYHHYSVYVCHLFMWLSLALKRENYDKRILKESCELDSNGLKSGIDVFKNENCMVVSFGGRREYLAETGPAIYAIWIRNIGVICKGAFAPWFGVFGNKYTNPIVAICNYFGLLEVSHDVSYINNKITRRFNIVEKCNAKMEVKPIYSVPAVTCDDKTLTIEIFNEKRKKCILNIPALRNIEEFITIHVDGVKIPCYDSFTINNQYGECTVYETGLSTGVKWSISFNFGGIDE